LRLSRRVILVFSALICLITAAAVLYPAVLFAMGSLLVNSENPSKADIVIVLGGDYLGNRVIKGAELVREGYAPKLMLSRGTQLYGRNESDIEADFAADRGYDRRTMIPLTTPVDSTSDEARTMLPQLRTMGVHKILLVTSPSHTGRAARVFRRAAPDIEIHPIAAPDPHWCRGYWWNNRECEKTFFLEEVKTLADFLRM
jgi:uncharacterized SAM-binding protein YcdF (DUF218 family)